jgi:hypothetical protein
VVDALVLGCAGPVVRCKPPRRSAPPLHRGEFAVFPPEKWLFAAPSFCSWFLPFLVFRCSSKKQRIAPTDVKKKIGILIPSPLLPIIFPIPFPWQGLRMKNKNFTQTPHGASRLPWQIPCLAGAFALQ